MIEFEVSSYQEFLDQVRPEILAGESLLFRGQADSRYIIQSSFDRLVEPFEPSFEDRVNGYQEILERFKLTVVREGLLSDVEIEAAQSSTDIEALCQHHGLPTRLIDWSYSPYIALFFAFGGVRVGALRNTHVAVYTFNEVKHRQAIIYDRRRDRNSALSIKNMKASSDAGHEPLTGNFESIHSYKVESLRSFNPRIHAQRGCFYVSPLRAANFEDYNKSMLELDEWLIKYIIPAEQREELIRDLNLMGINLASMYRNIDAVAVDIVNEYISKM